MTYKEKIVAINRALCPAVGDRFEYGNAIVTVTEVIPDGTVSFSFSSGSVENKHSVTISFYETLVQNTMESEDVSFYPANTGNMSHNIFTRRDEWGLAVSLNAIVREATHVMLWLSEQTGDDKNRDLNIRAGLEQMDANLRNYRDIRRHGPYRPRKANASHHAEADSGRTIA